MSAARGDVHGLALQLHWPTDEGGGRSATSSAPRDGGSEDPERAAPATEAGASSDGSEQDPLEPHGLQLPATLARIDAPRDEVWAAVARMSMQIDGMTAASNSLRVALTDRLAEYTDALGQLARHQSAVLEDHRRSNAELTNELREMAAAPDEEGHQQVSRLETVVEEVAALAEALRADHRDSQRASAAAERLPQVVAEGLEGFATRILERISAADLASDALAELRSDIAALREELARLRAQLAFSSDGQSMSEAQRRQIISEVAEHSARTAPGPTLSPDQMDAIAQSVVKRLQQSFMLVDDDRA